WKIRLNLVGRDSRHPEAKAGSSVRFDAWLERDDEGQTGITRSNVDDQSRISADDEASTIGTLSCGDDALVVTAYDASNSDVELSAHSAHGPPRHRRIGKPDISAPGEWIWLARSKSDKKCIWASG